MRIFSPIALWVLFALVIGGPPGTQAAVLAAVPFPKQVLAFYYGWFGNPQVSGICMHWKEVDTAKKQIGGSTHHPALGAYDSYDLQVVEQHCREAKEVGITGFLVT